MADARGDFATRALSAFPVAPPRGKERSALTGATAVAFSTLLNSPQHRASFEELAHQFWPQDRPAHWNRLVRMNTQWLRRSLPPSWSLTEDDIGITLVLDNGAIENFALVDGVVTDISETSSFASEKATRPTSSKATGLSQAPGEDSLACAKHRNARTSLPSLTRATGYSFVTYTADQPAPDPNVWRQMLANEGHPPGFTFVAGTAPDIAFGDTAAAFAAARWELLDLEGGTEEARVAKAWRILREHLPSAGDPNAATRCGVIFDAHNMDDSSLELARLIVRFPLADNLRIAYVGDATDPRPGWQQLLRDSTEAGWPHVRFCPDCDPRLLTGVPVSHQSALCG